MNLFRSLFIGNYTKISPYPLSIALRFCSNESSMALKEKIPKISDERKTNNFLDVIEQHETAYYDKRANKDLHNVQRFKWKRKKKLEEMLLSPSDYHPVIFNLLSAKNGSEILDILKNININDYPQKERIDIESFEDDDSRDVLPTIHRIHCKAIRCCADLGEMEICWEIFVKCKEMNIISNELYNTMMWCCMYTVRNEQSLNKVFKLNDELQKIIIQNNLHQSPRTYSTLINSCIKVRNYKKGQNVLEYVKQNYPNLLNNSRLIHAAFRLLINSGNIDEGIQLIESNESNNNDINWSLFANDILFALAKKISFGSFNSINYIEKGEEIFKKALSEAYTNNIEIPVAIFNGMVAIYANNDDYHSCYILLKHMVNSSNKYKLFPSPTVSTFEQILKSLVNHQNSDEKWKKCDEIYQDTEYLKIQKNFSFYCRLFEVCGDNLDKAMKYYNNMINIDNIEPNVAVLRCLFRVGANKDHWEQQQLEQFIQWIIDQCSQYNIQMTDQEKQEWKRALIQHNTIIGVDIGNNKECNNNTDNTYIGGSNEAKNESMDTNTSNPLELINKTYNFEPKDNTKRTILSKEQSNLLINSSINSLLNGSKTFNKLTYKIKSILGIGLMNVIVTNESFSDFPMENRAKIVSVLHEVGGGKITSYNIKGFLVDERVNTMDIGYAVDDEVKELIKKLMESQNNNRIESILASFKEAMKKNS